MNRRDQGLVSPWRDRVRFLLLLLGVGGGILFGALLSGDGPPRFWGAIGVWLATYGVVDLLWLATVDIERIWASTKAESIGLAIVKVAVGAFLIWVAFPHVVSEAIAN